MKLVVNKVSYGLVPYGPGTGNRAIGIYFTEVEGEFDYVSEKDEKGNDLTTDPVTIKSAGLLKDILDSIQAAKLEIPWANFLLGREYTYFIGEETANPAYRDIIANLMAGLSHMALEVQKKAFKDVEDQDKLSAVKKQLHAPMPVFVGQPKYYTGKDTFYENFNLVLLQVPLSENPEFNQMTMVEVANHAFSTYVLKMNKKDFETQKKVLEESYEKIGALSLAPQRIFIVDEDGDDEIAQFALDRGYRINHKMGYSEKYQLDF